jgi:cellulose biosynthesis protein BcsQ
MNTNVEAIRERIAECYAWADAYDYDYDPDDPSNLAEDYRQEAWELEKRLAELTDNTRG